MPRDLHPSDGARYLLEREGEGEGVRARYRVAIYTAEAVFAATAELEEGGGVAVGETGAPEELQGRLVSMAKLVARDAARLRGEGMPPWPQRVLRWRR